MEKLTINRHGDKSSSNSSKEREIYTINYENLQSNKSFSSIECAERASSKDVELSLEVEITDSLKRFISEPRKCDSELMDVTIIEPDINDTKTDTMKKNDLMDVLSSMKPRDRENFLRNELKKSQIRKDQEMISFKQSPHRKIVMNKTDHCVRNKEASERKKKKDCFKSEVKNYSKERVKQNYTFNGLTEKHSSKYIPVDLMKPLFGEIRESLKNVEARIIEMGDNAYPTKTDKTDCGHCSLGETTSDECDFYKPNNFIPDAANTNKHVYATPLTFDKLKATLRCQNEKRDTNDDNQKETPCLCQHCGMIGLLIESQKQPIVPSKPTILPDVKKREEKKKCLKDNTRHKRISDLSSSTSTSRCYQNLCLIKELSAKVNYLEKRLMEHEQKSVTKDYFKKIINKVMALYYHAFAHSKVKTNNKETNFPATQNISTQCSRKESSRKSLEYNDTSFCLNPVVVNRAEKKIEIEPFEDNSKNPNETLKVDESCNHRPEIQSICTETSWRWGDDILKPGSDLKTKILSLLEENFEKIKQDNSMIKQIFPKKVDNEIQTDFNYDEDCENQVQPKKSFRHFLDILSAKIYNEHILNSNNNSDFVSKSKIKSGNHSSQIKKSNPVKDKNNLKMDFFEPLKIPSVLKYESNSPSLESQIQSYIPLKKSGGIDKKKNTMIPKLKSKQSKSSLLSRNAVYYILNENKQYCKKTDLDATKTSSKDLKQKKNEKVSSYKKPICIEYVNPKIYQWNSTTSTQKSRDECDLEDDEQKKLQKKPRVKQKKFFTEKMSLEEKLEFFETMAKSKNLDKEKLWNSIWKQAKNYGKSKQDKITIQIPVDNLGDDDCIITELEFTIEDIEKLADKKRIQQELSIQSNCVESASSCITLNKLKNMEKLHRDIDKSLTSKIC